MNHIVKYKPTCISNTGGFSFLVHKLIYDHATTSYTYYDDNRIHTVTLPSNEVITFTYFADGSRATKETSTEWITYHYATGLVKEVHHLASDHNTTTFTLHYEPGRIIHEPYGGTPTTYYTVTDTQGTIYKLLDTSGTTIANYTYDPFGNRLTNSAPTIYNPIGFAGTYLDTESGLYFAQSRYLDPTTSRFTTKDSYRGDLQSHISQNRYIYCHQNPISYSDPSGFAPIEGDNSNSTPTSTTRTKTEHKENITPPKPPEKNPNGFADDILKQAGKIAGLLGDQIQEKPYEYPIKIDGHNLIFTITRTGKVKIVSDGTIEGDTIANSLNDALAVPGVLDSVLSFINNFNGAPGGIATGILALGYLLTDFSRKNNSKFRAGNGSNMDYTLENFWFSALVGFAAAYELNRSTDPRDVKLRASLKYALGNWQNTTGESISVFDFLWLQAFTTVSNYRVFNKSTGHYELGYGLTFGSFSDIGKTGYDSKVGLFDIVRTKSQMWLSTSCFGQFDGDDPKFDWGKARAKVVDDLSTFVIGNIPGIGAFVNAIMDLTRTWSSFMITGNTEFTEFNSSGLSTSMIDILINNNIMNEGVKGDKSIFGSIMTGSAYFDYQTKKNVNDHKNKDNQIKLGDLVSAAFTYLSAVSGGTSRLNTICEKTFNVFTHVYGNYEIFTNKNIRASRLEVWEDNNYVDEP